MNGPLSVAHSVRRSGWAFWATWMVVALVALPLLGLGLSFFQPVGLFETDPVSVEQLTSLFGRTLLLALVVSTCSLVLGTWLAYAEAKWMYPGRRVLGLLSTLPLAIPSYLMAGVIREVMAPRGVVGGFLGLTEAFRGLGPAILVLTLSCTPAVQLLVSAAFSRTSPHEVAAARLLGADPWRIFWKIEFPRLRPTWAFALVIIGFYVIADFGAVAILDCNVLTWALYQARNNPQDVARIGAAIVLVTLPLLAVIRMLQGDVKSERRVDVVRRASRTHPPPAALALTYAVHTLLIGVGLLPVLSMLVLWTGQGWVAGNEFASISSPLMATIVFTVVGALVTLLCAFLPSWFVARHRGRGVDAAEHGVYLTSALPGILIATGLFVFLLAMGRLFPLEIGDVSLWTTLEASGVFLILGYTMRFLSEGYAAMKPAFLRVDLRQEESARVLGGSPVRIFRHITWPTISPGVAAAYLLLFLAIAKELPITLMLTPLGQQTLAYRVFDAHQEGALPEAGLAALVLLVLAVGMHTALYRRREDV